ncbi:MAG: recombinase [Oscillospiraceae bacterium]|nr:recombinase [Oscillospiraceae bacterium]
METQNNGFCYADMYLRISREDGDKTESDSIANQREQILAFLKERPEMILRSVRVDDGYSGVNFERPAFIAMMEAVKNKEISCIIVKDFSRLGRNFIETSRYIQRIFPCLGVRFISINDNYDSIQPKTSSDNLVVPVKNLMNDAYCRDISIKIRSNFITKRKNGQCVAAFVVFGYLKDPKDRHKLIVDEFAASIVQDIFKQKLEGWSAQAIADRLNEEAVLSPLEYKRWCGSNYASTFKRNAKARWTAVSILRILKNPVYIGILEQGKSTTPNYKVKKRFDVPKEKWICVPNSHEAIISRETFENVAKILLSDTRTSPWEDMVFPLSGLIFCGDCGRSMVRKNNAGSGKPYYYYICSGYKNKAGCHSSHSIRAAHLEQAVLAALQQHIRGILNIEHTLNAIDHLPYAGRQIQKTDQRLKAKHREIEQYRDYQLRLHEDYVDGILSRADYISFGARYTEKIEEAQRAVYKLEQEIEQLTAGYSEEQQWISDFKRHQTISELNRKLVIELIGKVLVFEHQNIQIQFQFQDQYEHAFEWIRCLPVAPKKLSNRDVC